MNASGLCAAVALAIALAVPKNALAACASPGKPVTISQAQYGPDTTFEALDAYLPAGTSSEPLILFVHGGRWTSGDKAQYRELGQTYAACGIAFAALNYHLAPAHADAQAGDVDKAVKWALDNAAVKGYARTKIFLMGHGAGAELASLAALDPKLMSDGGVPARSIAGVIALDSLVYDPSHSASAAAANPNHFSSFIAAFGSDPAQWKQYDCSQFVKGGEPPFLVVHGVDDYLASAAESADFVDALTRAHDKVSYLEPAGSDFSGVLVNMVRSPNDPVLAAVVRFVNGP
ncbi:MAG: alpha/beta hydrolase [Candidatus Eremiobacteraeota bacterium]|nr:alpha/beta hydrolase [Candidatus Eremiobacteraeota bacterium]